MAASEADPASEAKGASRGAGAGVEEQAALSAAGPVALSELRLVHAVLAGIGGAGLAVLLAHAVLGSAGSRLGVLAWSWGAAAGAFLAGAALGLLFGLPNVRNVRIVNSDDAKSGASQTGDRSARLGYTESTNLEQVADWLTKIIIGLTLTQYHHWEARFARLSYDLTCRMMTCGPVLKAGEASTYPPGTTVPGGFLMVGYAALGFLMAYLWMRGYFISEMEAARTNAIINTNKGQVSVGQTELEKSDLRSKARFRRYFELMRSQGLAPHLSGTAFHGNARTMLKNALERMKGKGQDVLGNFRQLTEGSWDPEDPNDPWHESFGGSATRNGLSLTATVATNPENPAWFDVDLYVAVAGSQRDRPGFVQYFLHPAYGTEPRLVRFGPDGRAHLSFLATFGFTVGVLADDGTTLELDLGALADPDTNFLVR
jgi:hypothetical protein